MNIPNEWLFPENLTQAAEVQRSLSRQVITEDRLPDINCVAGLDVSNNLRDPEHKIYAAVVCLSIPDLKILETQSVTFVTRFPYIPGFLGFREAPALVMAFEKLARKPDLIMVDGHGISHPRRFGIASHLGVLLDCPSIGVGKSVMVGTPKSPLGPEPGARTPLIWKGETVGMVVRTRQNANPLYISTGHRISLETSVDWVLSSCRGYRLPEPTRQAHLAANTARTNGSLLY